MAIKTFNVEEETYRKFSDFCKTNGFSMSKQVEFFMKSIVEEKEQVREEYLLKLEKIRSSKDIRIGDINAYKKRFSTKK